MCQKIATRASGRASLTIREAVQSGNPAQGESVIRASISCKTVSQSAIDF